MSMIGFPLLLIPLAIYNIVVFLMQGVSFDAPLLALTLTSGKTWTATFSDGLLALGMLLLMVEVIKAAKPGAKYFTDHLLSLLVFAGAAAEFVLLPQFATSTFFLLTVLALVDFLASLAIRARRSVTVDAPARGSRRAAPVPAPVSEPKFEPSAATDLAPPVASPPPEPAAAPASADDAQPQARNDPAASAPPQPR